MFYNKNIASFLVLVAAYAGVVVPSYANTPANTLNTYVVESYGGTALLPSIRPMLAAGGSVQSYQNRLIIRTTASNYLQVRELLKQIDKLPNNLRISLKVAEKSQQAQQNLGADVVIAASKGSVQAGGRINYSHKHENHSGTDVYQIKALSGSAASISAGTLQQFANGFWGQSVLSVTKGIDVLPTLLPNNQVNIKINQYHYGNNPQIKHTEATTALNTQRSQTELNVPVGVWQHFGSIDQQSHFRSHTGYSKQQQNLPLMIKIDKLP